MTILSMMDIVDVVEEEIKEGMEHDHHDDGHHHDDLHHEGEEVQYDEHVWTSPVNAKSITQAIPDTLCSLDESHAPFFGRTPPLIFPSWMSWTKPSARWCRALSAR